MKAGPEADALYVHSIIDLILLIQSNVSTLGEADFLADRTVGDATALRLGAIGEFSSKLSKQFKSRHPEIPWVKLIKLRNIVAHHYDRLDYRILWEVATLHLDPLYVACRAELDEIDG
jgi:uncharacterized protein with HEPN domain